MENKKHKLKIFVNSNAPWSTSGYGQQIAEFLPLIKAEGYDVAMCAFYGLEGGSIDWNGVKMYPKIGSVWGDDAMLHHANDFGADVVFSLQDIWVLDPNALKSIKRWIPIVPIDHFTIPPGILERLRLAYRVVTYSQFGFNELKRVGLHSDYIPHTVDTEVFTIRDKAEVKKSLGIDPDAYVVGMVAANKDWPPRKSFQEAMDAFKEFTKIRPNSIMYFHTQPDQNGGFPIKNYARSIGIEDKIRFTPVYDLLFKMNKVEMSKLYNAFDILLCPSTNEGFGVPIIEAQACGTPVITSNYTAMPELIIPGKTGVAVNPIHLRFDPLLSNIGVPNTREIYEGIMKFSAMDSSKVAKACRNHIVSNYDTAKVFTERWVPYLQKLENEIYSPEIDSKTLA